MYLCYRELLPATNIKCCCFFTLEAAHHLNSTASETQYLLVCSSSTLTIFHVLSGALQCSYSTQIYGTPRSVDAVRGASSSSSNRQSIILALDEGKIVVFEYLPSSRSLHLLLSFNAEENAFGLGAELLGETEGKVSHPGVEHIPTMAVDSSGKVAATVIYGHEILITPLCADIISPKMPPKSFILRNLRALGIERLALRDIVFLPGYASSTLAILHEVAALPIGHTFKISSTMAVTVIGIDIYRKAAYFVWKQRDLPSSSFRLHPLSFPSLSGTVLVISASAMLICGQDHVLAFAFSGFARQAVHKSIKLRPASLKIGIDLDASRWVTVADGASFLATLKTGVMLHVRLLLPIEGNWSSAQHVVEQLGITSIASSLTYSPSSNLLFIGSRESDAVLLQLELSPMNVDTIPNPKTALNAGGLSSIGTPAPPTKKARRISNKFEDSSELMASFANDETFLYGASLPIVPTETLSSASYQISFQVLDTVPVLGPVLTGIFSSGDTDIVDRSSEVDWERQAAAPLNTPSALAYIVARETKHALIVSAGMGDQASLYRVSRGLRYSKLAARNFYGCQSISALRFQDSNLHKICFLFLSFAQRTRVMRCLDAEAGDTAAMHEVIPALSGFVFVDSTVHVAMLSTDLCVQVYSSGLRVLKVSGVIDEALQDVLVEEELDLGGLGGSVGEFIVMADVCEEHVVVLTDRRNIFFLKYDFEAENLELICRGASGEEGPLSACLDAPPSSISFYKGLFEPSTGQPDDKSGKKTPSLVSEFAMEEEYFYGKALDDEGALEVEEVTMEESEVVGMSDKLYISVCNLYGGLSIIDLESFTVTFHSAAFSNAAMRVDANHLDTTPQDLPQSCSRTLARAHLQRIHSEAHSKLCLVAVLDTYDVLVYYALEEKGAISAFLKMEHGCVTRKRSKLKSPHSDLEMKTWNRILLSDYSVNKITNDLNMACGIIVSGPNPVVISLHKGLPSVQPLGFPEIAYANTGSYLVVPVQSSGVKGVACLWQEREESASGDVKPSKEAVIGLYQEIPLQTPLSNRSSLSFKRLNVGMTVHKALEILPHSQDPTELALLKRKTLLLACSEELQLPFLPSVLTDEQFEEDINT